jgi:hypothetical protein
MPTAAALEEAGEPAWQDPTELAKRTGTALRSAWQPPALKLPVVLQVQDSERNPSQFSAGSEASTAPDDQ